MAPRSSAACLVRSSVARIVIAAGMVYALLAGVIPLGALSAPPACQMACCAGAVPHAAGSCAGGVCHVDFAHGRTGAVPHARARASEEKLCGADGARPARIARAVGSPATGQGNSSRLAAHHRSAHDAARMSARALSRPCQPGCGAGACASVNQSRPRDAAALSTASGHCLPARRRDVETTGGAAAALSALCRRSRPRAPPCFFS
jgi:hypothetical protein